MLLRKTSVNIVQQWTTKALLFLLAHNSTIFANFNSSGTSNSSTNTDDLMTTTSSENSSHLNFALKQISNATSTTISLSPSSSPSSPSSPSPSSPSSSPSPSPPPPPQLNRMECALVLHGLAATCRRERAAKVKSSQFREKPPPPTTMTTMPEDNESACCKATFMFRCLQGHLKEKEEEVNSTNRRSSSFQVAACRWTLEQSAASYGRYFQMSCTGWDEQKKCRNGADSTLHHTETTAAAFLTMEVIFSLMSSLLSYLLATKL